MKFNLNGYYHPTPRRVRQFADSVMAACMFAAPSTATHAGMTEVLLYVGMGCKFLSNFFVDDNNGNTTKS